MSEWHKWTERAAAITGLCYALGHILRCAGEKHDMQAAIQALAEVAFR